MLKEKEAFQQDNKVQKTQFENCIICGEETQILMSTPIDCRENYVYGCGQLCAKCANEIRQKENPNNLSLSSESMKRLLYILQKDNKED